MIQHHAASTDHYDFRLQIDGVPRFVGRPQGPSINPKEKRMARRTEDHPIGVRGIRGVIPEENTARDASSSGTAARTTNERPRHGRRP